MEAADLARLLERTSRTFALAIPLLDEPLRAQVGAAYLLFRIADTLEDAELWGRETRHAALLSCAEWLEGRGEEWRDLVRRDPPTHHEGCRELLDRAADVLASIGDAGSEARRAIIEHTARTARGMAGFVARQDPDGRLALRDVEDLRRYAYAVAGIVGELLTALFALSSPSIAAARGDLDAHAAAFGEGLQLVNILKDAPADAAEGRAYLPAGVPQGDVVALARKDLEHAAEYVAVLRRAGASRGTVAFCALPLRLADATLEALAQGLPKLGREDVARILAAVTSD